MRRAVLGTLVGLGLVTAAVAVAVQRGEVFAQYAAPATPGPMVGSELIVVPTSLGERGQMLTVVDPRQRVLSVYHIELPTGKITLKSVRNMQWDLQVEEFNNVSPSPKEIRSQLEQR
jgi:hypothetical protein